MPLRHYDIETIVTTDKLKEMAEQKRALQRSSIPLGTVSVRKGSLNTQYGCFLTRDEAMAAIDRKNFNTHENNPSTLRKKV